MFILLEHITKPVIVTGSQIPLCEIRSDGRDNIITLITERLKGIVIETFGAVNIPGYGGALLPIIEKAFANGTIVTVCSQCPQGSVLLSEYETSMPLKNAGAVSGLDITTEAAVAKLYYLFSKGYTADKIKYLMGKNLCGEMKDVVT